MKTLEERYADRRAQVINQTAKMDAIVRELIPLIEDHTMPEPEKVWGAMLAWGDVQLGVMFQNLCDPEATFVAGLARQPPQHFDSVRGAVKHTLALLLQEGYR